jgi:glycosyltransferase involved in cell wall biosynthesis
MLPLSVIIPSYNRAAQLDATLDALTQQSRTDFLTIVVDHDSSDHTAEVCQRYQERLHLRYYWIAREQHHSAGVPRAFGVQQAETPLIAFLDTGMVVPASYVDAHITFHRLHPQYVGIGLQHGYQGMDSQQEGRSSEEVAAELLHQIGIEQAYRALKLAHLEDQRTGVDLATSHTPWFFGWTANLSLARAAYEQAGGFDLTLAGWGFEDGDLSYRLYKQGWKFAFVEDGWGIELPQPRRSMRERFQSNQQNMLHCYAKQRSLGLEALILAELQLREVVKAYRQYAATTGTLDQAALGAFLDQMRTQFAQHIEEIFIRLSEAREKRSVQMDPLEPLSAHLARPTLLIGGTPQDAQYYDYVTLGDERVASTASVWSCLGVLLPTPEQSLATVVVSDVWKHLLWSVQAPAGLPGVPLLEHLVIEIKRAANRAVFLHTPADLENRRAALELLEDLCHKHQLDFQLVCISHTDPLAVSLAR